jgi:hypothetical protein
MHGTHGYQARTNQPMRAIRQNWCRNLIPHWPLSYKCRSFRTSKCRNPLLHLYGAGMSTPSCEGFPPHLPLSPQLSVQTISIQCHSWTGKCEGPTSTFPYFGLWYLAAILFSAAVAVLLDAFSKCRNPPSTLLAACCAEVPRPSDDW